MKYLILWLINNIIRPVMGCFQSKKKSAHKNIFRVVNIDENRVHLCSGQLEISTSDIILYRVGRESTVWPLHSLRRYGFEGEIFSFESGRRCETGEGIYAFRCRKASFIFQALQQRIQARNDSVTYPVSRHTPSPQGRQTLQASVVHRSSIDNGQANNIPSVFHNNPADISHSVLRPETQSPRSPSNTDILEVMPLYPRSQSSNTHVSNVYQLRDFKREHNNNQAELVTDAPHMYTNDFNRDLAMLRNTLKQLSTSSYDLEDETLFLESRNATKFISYKTANTTLSPTLSHSSEHYAQLSIEQPSRLYVNVVQNDSNTLDGNKNDTGPTTPLTPKQVEYCNLSVGMKPELNSYANLMLGDSTASAKPVGQGGNSNEQNQNQKFSESDTFTSMSPVEELEVNYAILDIDPNNDVLKTVTDVASPESQSFNSSKNESTASCSSRHRNKVVSQLSFERSQVISVANPVASTSIGYTTIDFDKTVALTSVAAGTEVIMESCRKNRHNSCSIFTGSPGSSDKNRGNN